MGRDQEGSQDRFAAYLPRICRVESESTGIGRAQSDGSSVQADPAYQPLATQKEALTCCSAGQSLIFSFC